MLRRLNMETKYTVSILRTSWCDFEVTAKDVSEAYAKGLQAAANHNWVSEDAEYSVTDIDGGDDHPIICGYSTPDAERQEGSVQ
jgi:hypothetical protein